MEQTINYNNLTLNNLIYFRRLLISLRTKHLTCQQVIDRVQDLESFDSYLDDLKKNNPNIKKKVDNEINRLCHHEPVDDLVEECAGDVLVHVRYCKYCESNLPMD